MTWLTARKGSTGMKKCAFCKHYFDPTFEVIAPKSSNGVGVIDSDYRGEIAVGLHNSADAPYTVQPGDRIAQLAVVPVVRAELEQTDELDETGRGVGGFGSTGK